MLLELVRANLCLVENLGLPYVDLLQDDPSVIASEASTCDATLRRQSEIRLSAWKALIASQDCKALTEGLRARPRVTRDFVSGQWVAYTGGHRSLKKGLWLEVVAGMGRHLSWVRLDEML